MKAIVAVLDRKGKKAVQTAVSMLKVLGHGGADAFGIATQNRLAAGKSLEELPVEGFRSSTAIGHVFLKVLAKDKPQPIQIEGLALVFDGRIYNQPVEPSEADFVAKKLHADSETGAEALIKEFDGYFAFTMAKNEKLVVGRDSLGLYPLYYGENSDLLAIASERKALWKIGIKVHPFPPGHIMIADKKGFKIRLVKTLKRSTIAPASMENAAKKLQMLLEQSTEERVRDLSEVAVAFSGGLDSSLIAWLAKEAGVKVHLIHVSLKNQPETEQAEKAASLLGMPLHAYLYDEGNVEQTLPKVLLAIEDHNPVMVCIGVPMFWAAEKAAELGFKVLFTGQGADEYFGGYRRYLNLYKRFGEDTAEKALAHDILTMYEKNFERDSKICTFNNLELRLPFASYPIAEFALNLPLRLKIESPNDSLRKAVLRKAAEKFGLPPPIVNKPKKAVQYATGVAKAVRRLAKRERLTVKQFLQKIFFEVFEKF
jgi:asparagine synthase (glutamine-hydrolysing)